ncbi:MAG: homoserine kinase [Bdellovibrionota bacterium]|nr:homoserine kinase [Bdellovibrionota bacterium]
MKKDSSTVFAPATVANLSVGFDILGLAIHGFGDTVTVTKRSEKSVHIEDILGADLPKDPEKNTATLPLLKMIETLNLNFGFSVKIEKGIPLCSGLGGSAASAAACTLAANFLLDNPLKKEELMPFALEGEALASGSKHADNVAVSLLGGLLLITSVEPFQYVRLPIPKNLNVIVWHPHQKIDTLSSRGVLKEQIPLALHIEQSKKFGGFLSGLYENDYKLMKDSCEDIIVGPQRKHLIPFFDEAKKIAEDHDALGFSISGGGPTLFALAEGSEKASAIEKEVTSFFKFKKIGIDSTISKVNQEGSYLVS